MSNARFEKIAVAYCRVSTRHQGRHGRSLRSQKCVLQHLAEIEGIKIVDTFHESKSARGDHAWEKRPQLQKCLARARELNCPIIATKFDRLSRDEGDSKKMKESGVHFQFGDDFGDSWLAACAREADEDAREIALRSPPGIRSGPGNPRIDRAQKTGVIALRRAAVERYRDALPVFTALEKKGSYTDKQFATQLDVARVRTRSGIAWTPQNAGRVRRELLKRRNQSDYGYGLKPGDNEDPERKQITQVLLNLQKAYGLNPRETLRKIGYQSVHGRVQPLDGGACSRTRFRDDLYRWVHLNGYEDCLT